MSSTLKSLDIVKITELLEDQDVVKGINSITPEKLKLILNNGNFSFENIIKTLKDKKIVDCINSIAPEKLKLIFNKFSSQNIIKVLEDQDGVKGINSVTTKELKAITDNVIGKVFVSIFKNFEPSIKSTLRFVIPLFRADQVRDINIDYLNNKERIYEDIIKYVPQDLRIYTQYPFPGIGIDVKDLPQGLDIDIEPFIPLPTFKRCTESKEPVSKLYNLYLEQVIENINPHKKARYS